VAAIALALVALTGCAAAAESEPVGEAQQALHYGIWRFSPDEDAAPNGFYAYPGGAHWALVDDWRSNLNVTPSATFDDGFVWTYGSSFAGEVFEPASGMASNPTLYNSIVSIDHVDLYWAMSNSTGHNITVRMNFLDEWFTGVAGPGTYLAHGTRYTHSWGAAYTKQEFADPNVDGIYFGVGASGDIGSSGSFAIGAVRLEVVYATP
jgi:hypothetical protein